MGQPTVDIKLFLMYSIFYNYNKNDIMKKDDLSINPLEDEKQAQETSKFLDKFFEKTITLETNIDVPEEPTAELAELAEQDTAWTNDNVAIGHSSGQTVSGEMNVAIGYQSTISFEDVRAAIHTRPEIESWEKDVLLNSMDFLQRDSVFNTNQQMIVEVVYRTTLAMLNNMFVNEICHIFPTKLEHSIIYTGVSDVPALDMQNSSIVDHNSSQHVVSVETRKFTTRATDEIMKEIVTTSDLYMRDEVYEVIGRALATEHNKELVKILHDNSTYFSMDSVTPASLLPELLQQIVSSYLTPDTGFGNWMLVGNNSLIAILNAARVYGDHHNGLDFNVTIDDLDFHQDAKYVKIGTIFGVSLFFIPTLDSNEIIIGRKPKKSIDSLMTYVPHIVLMIGDQSINPETYLPVRPMYKRDTWFIDDRSSGQTRRMLLSSDLMNQLAIEAQSKED